MRIVNVAAVAIAACVGAPVSADIEQHAAGGHGSGAGGAARSFPITENFDSYSAGLFPCSGPGCAGPNGWGLWYATEPGGPNPGAIVASGAHSSPNALRLSPISDITQTGNITSGQWVVRAFTFFPSAATATTDQGYFIVMHAYNGVPSAPDQWALQIHFDGAAGTVYRDFETTNTLPMIRDQWVELRAEINLGANTCNLFYGGQALPTAFPYASTGTPAIVCLDLYSDGVDGMMYDDISIQPAGSACYANCDNSTTPPVLNVQDFSCFLTKYASGDAYANCDASTTPPVLNVQDFSCFLTKYASGCSAP